MGIKFSSMEEVVINMFINRSFWKNKKVFITGHTGFKGSWMTIWLEKMGSNIAGFSLEPQAEPNLFTEAKLFDGITNYYGDIRNGDILEAAILEFQPDILIHMAAQPLVRYSYKEPIETFTTNIIGTANVLESARKSESIKAIINVTTDKCYENKEWEWAYRENDMLGGYDPYSSSKACSEIITSAYRNSFFNDSEVAIASARAGNVIGGGDWSDDRLVPDALKAFENNHSVLVRNPKSIRPWQHVLEPISGYLMLAESLFHSGNEFAEAWNFGPYDQDTQSVEFILNKLTKYWGHNASWESDSNLNPHEANYLKLDISKASTKLNWKPTWDLNSTLERIVDWHKGWLNGSSPKELCINEIESFEKDNE
jgi:CDP-glucose 4,6-dehydratase